MTDILLTQPHTHAGVDYLAGDRIAVDAASAAWLIAVGAAAMPEPSDSKPAPRGKGQRMAPSAEPAESLRSPDQE